MSIEIFYSCNTLLTATIVSATLRPTNINSTPTCDQDLSQLSQQFSSFCCKRQQGWSYPHSPPHQLISASWGVVLGISQAVCSHTGSRKQLSSLTPGLPRLSYTLHQLQQPMTSLYLRLKLSSLTNSLHFISRKLNVKLTENWDNIKCDIQQNDYNSIESNTITKNCARKG
eukprot:TRINITY_DN19666_c0_g1_i1.p1 TRINITY_DN19666_c0_g1~~TRINITY_DN19666_c0_g1_i1.p1  ORF type:complete len:171 (+),score=0.39 TRINITY_DN19666_c0_g1_i1:150-662(+)